MLFIIIGFFVLFVIIFVNVSNRIQKNEQHQKIEPRRVTVDNLQEVKLAKQQMVREFENVIETGLKDALNDSVKWMPSHATDNTTRHPMALICNKKKNVIARKCFPCRV